MALQVGVCLLLFIVSCSSPNKETQTSSEEPANEGFASIFFAIDSTKIPIADPATFEKNEKMIKAVNLSGEADFWPGKKNYFMQAWGTLDSPKDGKFYFRLISAGGINLKINNKEMFKNKEIHSQVAQDTSFFLQQGKNNLELEYFDGGEDPKLVLMWSEDGENFEVIPDANYGRADNSLANYEVSAESSENDSTSVADNTLTEEEIAEGWKLLFDGETTNGWHTYNKPGEIGSKWSAIDGTLNFAGRERFRYMFEGKLMEMGDTDKKNDGGIDIVTDDTFENFELKLEWRISHGGNSGIFYTVLEDPKYDEAWKTSPEMQVLHNEVHKDGIIYKHRAGDLYDLIPASPITVKSQGEWNKVKVVKNQGKVEHWLNGSKVVEYDLNSEEWKTMIASSKFSKLEDFGTAGPRHIGLQDHDNQLAFKNIKIREL